jgi:hypothetical protein
MSIRITHESAAEFTARMSGQHVTVREAMTLRTCTDLATWTYEDVPVAAGERVEVVSMTNAGFRGMELSIRTAAGLLVTGVTETAFAR